MLISPPFLPARNADDLDAVFVDAAMPDAAVNCFGTSVPEGSFPVSLKLGWHGGVHLHAPSGAAGVLPVRAIADGEIVYARRPTAQVDTPTHPLNYNPYGDQAAWTDDGMVVIRHTTDIGDCANAQDVVFYSVYMHLSQLRGAANTVAASATATTRRIYRKDEIGSAGRIYAAPDHIHFEIVCDDANLNKLINRQTGDLALTADGRTDAVYGEIYFHLPVGTMFYQNNPGATVVTPTAEPLYTSSSDLFIGLRYAGGEGVAANRGDAYLSTYLADGTQLGDAAGVIEENEAEYKLYASAMAFSTAQPTALRPAPSAAYEFLRFGRIIDTAHETAIPGTIPHWKQVRYERGLAWVNLNNQAGDLRVHVFSDADFPQWRGWKLIQDDTDDDSRCESALLTGLIEDASATDGRLSPAELIQQLGESSVRKALEKTICKFPSELNRDTIDARWGWLQTDPEYQLVGESWTNFRAHVEALTVPAASLPEPLRTAHWHFHPRAFVRKFRKCGWLSSRELAQCIPRKVIEQTKNKAKQIIYPRSSIPWDTALNRANRFRSVISLMLRKYSISSSKLRLSYFFANSIQETTYLSRTSEGGGRDLPYAPWYGRGLLQLTWEENFQRFKDFKAAHSIPLATHRDSVETNIHLAAESAGFYWVSCAKTLAKVFCISREADVRPVVNQITQGSICDNYNYPDKICLVSLVNTAFYDCSQLERVARAVNTGNPGSTGIVNGLVPRKQTFIYSISVLLDEEVNINFLNHEKQKP